MYCKKKKALTLQEIANKQVKHHKKSQKPYGNSSSITRNS